MSKKIMISHVREIEKLFTAYLEVIYTARQDTLRIISSLEGVVLNLDLLEAAPPVAGSPGKAKEDLRLMTTQVRELALMALAAANHTVTMIQENIPRAQEGAAQTAELVAKLGRREAATAKDYDYLIAILAEIKQVTRRVEDDAVKCVAAVRALLPQVENLHYRMLALQPRAEKPGRKNKKAAAGKRPRASLYIVEGVH
ncbi:MAG: hypothetical protein PHU44_00745 [Syntrophales bacterium]|nr:hypothetical protein [Syntrophales bacterium]MDD5643227.1 hypothetical protein [Syntrophales bacterium]